MLRNPQEHKHSLAFSGPRAAMQVAMQVAPNQLTQHLGPKVCRTGYVVGRRCHGVEKLKKLKKIHPMLIYRWQKNWFEQGAVVFDAPRDRSGNGRREDAGVKRIVALEEKLRRKDEVLSELDVTRLYVELDTGQAVAATERVG